MSTSAVVINLLLATPKKDKKKILIILLSIFVILILCILMVFYIISPSNSNTFESVISDIKEQRKYDNDLNATGVRAIYLLHYNEEVPSYGEARSFVINHFIVKKERRFKTSTEILDYVQSSPFNYKNDYLELVYYSFYPYMLFQGIGNGNNSDSANPPPSLSDEKLPDSFIGRFSKPCDGRYTSTWGYRKHPVTGKYEGHTGVDIQGAWHQPIKSIADGVVESTNTSIDGYGNYIKIKHEIDGVTFYSFYAHMSELHVSAGQQIGEGQIIGLEGGDPKKDINPGTSTGHHLHLEIRLRSHRNSNIDPAPYIR